jgi:3-phosphoglycerate kinase
VSEQKSGLRGIKTVRDFEFENKVVFLRLDLNVPMEKGKITAIARTISGSLTPHLDRLLV